ncbi:MAG: response regulator [Candidatus Korobacteraceae bacterium]|jgi:CheY-like chemotaxis protein
MSAKVLVIDDDSDFRAAVKSLLESHDYSVLEASSGHEGLQMVVEHKPDVILVDIMMESSVEGYGVTHSLKYRDEYAEFRNIPIFMISSIDQAPDDLFQMSPEADLIRPDGYLTKPLNIEQLLRLLEKAVGTTKAVRA